MRHLIQAVFFLSFFACVLPAAAEAPKTLTGDDWVRMFQGEQLEFVSVAMKAYQDQGIVFQKTAPFYVYALNTAIGGNSLYESASVTDILDEILLKNEPALSSPAPARDVQVQKIEMH